MRRNLQHAIEHVERPGSHEGVGRKKKSSNAENTKWIHLTTDVKFTMTTATFLPTEDGRFRSFA